MDQRFSKKEKLKSKKQIELLFQEGQSVKGFPLRLLYLESPLPYQEIMVQVGVSVPKRLHKLAVTRNRIKRLMREAYRLNKNLVDTKGTTFAVLILYTHREIPSYEDMDKAMVKLLKRFNDEISKTTPA